MPRKQSNPRRLTGDKRKFTGSARTFRYKKYARTNTSKSNIKQSQLVSKVLSAITENKIMPLTERVEVNPYPIQLGAQGYMYGVVLGGVPSPWNSSYWNDLGSVTPPSGVGREARIGNQYFLKRSTMILNVDCDKRTDVLPMEFRTIVAKPRRSANPTGTTFDPYLNLFLDGNQDPCGPGTSGKTLPQLFNSMINSRDFVTYSDTYDSMCGVAAGNNQLATVNTTHAPSYKSFFRKRITMPHNIKAHVNQAGRLTNYDPSYFCIVLARTIGQDEAAGRWNLWLQGTTSYNDS